MKVSAKADIGKFGLPEVAVPSQVSPRDAREMTKLFFERLSEVDTGTNMHHYVRNTLIEVNMSLVRVVAARFRRRTREEREEIFQVGMIGLIKAIDRFEIERNVDFGTFATPYISGEIKRHFRDTSWSVHVPRRLQEARSQLASATEELYSQLARTPTVKELAQFMQLSTEEVMEARLASNGYRSCSLDAVVNGAGDCDTVLAEFIGREDVELERVENFCDLDLLLAELGERDRRILHLRFMEECTQEQIGQRVGLSQMQISRLLNRALTRLREDADAEVFSNLD
ncbi:SigB/SigF/SigG family RNA polymerase sigma factor [Streptomyces sp. NPDC005529]|uniref:SigB/SigF/SigG family RNA polymerase sigma factor n=1 Tax=unclassified Streptomyces TaxID=2593676 RepID=UPI0033ADAB74